MVNNTRLKKLASLFPADAPLYAVGGCVRDYILGVDVHDIDLCSKLTVEEVKKVLSNSDFVVLDKNLRVGTVIIFTKNFKVEYTTFRTDSYPDGKGKHTPDEVRFTSDINEDARRRDFTCNALYYDVVKGETLDVLSSKRDIENRIIKTADDPDIVFGADGQRILRMVRFAAELGFEVDRETFESAKAHAPLVLDISVERIADELNKIFVADTKHTGLSAPDAHFRALGMLDELGLVDSLFPELAALKGLEQPAKWHLYDAYRHSAECFKVAPPAVRWAALLHDIGKRPCMEQDGNMHAHAEVGADMARVRLNAFKFPRAFVSRTTELIATHMINVNGNMSEAKLRWFVAEHAAIAEELAELKDADSIASNGEPLEDNAVRRIYAQLKKEGAPFSIKELTVDGNDLVELGVEQKERGILLYGLWRDTVMNPALREREKALAYLKKRSGK